MDVDCGRYRDCDKSIASDNYIIYNSLIINDDVVSSHRRDRWPPWRIRLDRDALPARRWWCGNRSGVTSSTVNRGRYRRERMSIKIKFVLEPKLPRSFNSVWGKKFFFKKCKQNANRSIHTGKEDK